MKLKKVLAMVLCIAMVLGTMSFTVFAEATVITLDEFVTSLENGNGVYDGNGITVKFTANQADTAFYNKPDTFNQAGGKVVQYYGLFGKWNGWVSNSLADLTISNVNFVFDNTDCINPNNSNEITTAEFTLWSVGDIKFTNCSFDSVSVDCAAGMGNDGLPQSATFSGCTFKNIENRNGIHQCQAKVIEVDGCIFENCDKAIHFNSAELESITITNNQLINVGNGIDSLITVGERNNFSVAVISMSDNTITYDDDATKANGVFNLSYNATLDEDSVVALEETNDFGELNAVQSTGTITPGFTNNTSVWGEGGANAKESFVVELYADDVKIAQASLNDYEDIIDGDLYVTWGIPFNGQDSDYWDVEWYGNNPNVNVIPTKVVLVVDGMKVDENEVQLNAPDNLNGVIWNELEGIPAEAKIGKVKYATLGEAIAAAAEGDVIDLMGNVIDLPEVNSTKIKKDLTITNGSIDITNGTWNGNAIIEVYGGTASDAVVATFDDVDFIGDNYSSAYGVIYAHSNGKVVINNCNFELSNEQFSAGGVLKGNGIGVSAFDVTNSNFDLENPNRVIANATTNLDGVTIKAAVTDDTLVVGDMNNHAFRNLVGTVNNSNISVDGFETGIKNTEGDLTISGNSNVVLTNSKDKDLVVGSGKAVTVEEGSKLYADTTDIADNATINGNGFISKADVVYVQYKKVDVDANDNDTVEGSDEYEIVLAGYDAEKINELASADLTFAFNGTLVTGEAMTYTVVPADGVTLTQLGDRFMFNYDGVNKYEETGTAIVIGTITIEGYGSYTLATADSGKNAVYATEIRNNIVDGFTPAAGLEINKDMVANDGMVGEIPNAEIAVPTRKLTIDIDFNNPVDYSGKDYQDMTVIIDGGTYYEEIKLGDKAEDDTIVRNLAINTSYTVTVKGAGYRTARYTVSLTGNKNLKFWNNVMDEQNAICVEEGKEDTKETVTFLAGDIVKDNKINIYDLSAVVAYFGTTGLSATNNPEYARYDLNRDGVIDSKDVAYVLVSWGK